MKKLISVVFALVLVLSLTACEKPNEKTSGDIIAVQEDEYTLEKVKELIRVVENKKDYYDESGELLFFIQKDYLETDSEDEAIRKIVANYPKEELDRSGDSGDIAIDVVRVYPDDGAYYDKTTYEISSVHNGIVNICQHSNYWMGSPHPYPSTFSRNFVLSTGEEYDFPDDLKEDIYDVAITSWMANAKVLQYEGLIGDYYKDDNTTIAYKFFDTTTGDYVFDENALREVVKDMLAHGSFEISDKKITFHMEAAYALSTWADKSNYSNVEIVNIWNL